MYLMCSLRCVFQHSKIITFEYKIIKATLLLLVTTLHYNSLLIISYKIFSLYDNDVYGPACIHWSKKDFHG